MENKESCHISNVGVKCCIACHISKNIISSFSKLKKSKDGYDSRCKNCKKIQNNQYYKKNQQKLLEQKKIYYKDNQSDILIKKTNYRNENRVKVRDSYNEFYSKNKESVQDQQKIYRKNNKDKIRMKNNAYVKRRRKIDPLFRAIKNVRSRLNKVIKRRSYSKTRKYSSYIGCETSFLRNYIEKQFKSGMSWDNYGKWHIDHIIPLSSAKTLSDLYLLSHYNNLQPLWRPDNLKKGNKII